MSRRRSVLGLVVIALLSACSRASLTPRETVGLYLRSIDGRDPMRVLPLLTAEFHRRHRMLFPNTVTLPDEIDFAAQRKAMLEDPEFAVEEGRLGWLVAPALMGEIYWMFPRLREIRLGWLENSVRGRRARVGLRAWVPDDARVDFDFILVRQNASEPWRISEVDANSDRSPHARFIGYLIAPDLDAVEFVRREVEARVGEAAEKPLAEE